MYDPNFNPKTATPAEISQQFYSAPAHVTQSIIRQLALKVPEPHTLQAKSFVWRSRTDVLFGGRIWRGCQNGDCKEMFEIMGNGKDGQQAFCNRACAGTVKKEYLRAHRTRRANETPEDRIARLRAEILKLEAKAAEEAPHHG